MATWDETAKVLVERGGADWEVIWTLTYAGCHRQVMSTAAMVASSGVLMLSRASARVRLAGSIAPLVAVRDCRRACCARARTPAVEGLTVHIPPGQAGNSRGVGSTLVVAAEGRLGR